jgi:hypothetical protein
MEDGIASADVREKGISKSLTFGCALYESGNVDNVEESWHFAAK